MQTVRASRTLNLNNRTHLQRRRPVLLRPAEVEAAVVTNVVRATTASRNVPFETLRGAAAAAVGV